MHCCSKRTEQLSSWISKHVAGGWFVSGHKLIRCLWNRQYRSDRWLHYHRQLHFIHSPAPLRHRSKSGYFAWRTLHRWSHCEWKRSVYIGESISALLIWSITVTIIIIIIITIWQFLVVSLNHCWHLLPLYSTCRWCSDQVWHFLLWSFTGFITFRLFLDMACYYCRQ